MSAALRYTRSAAGDGVSVTAPFGGTHHLYMPSERARAHFVTAVLKAKCQPGEDLEILGESVPALKPRARARLRRRVGALSPTIGLMSNLNAWENISLQAAYHGTPPISQVASITRDVLDAFGVEPQSFLAKLPDDLGNLERKIAAFVRLLIAAPELALIDSLQDGLNRDERARVTRFETEFRARHPGSTLIFVETREEDTAS